MLGSLAYKTYFYIQTYFFIYGKQQFIFKFNKAYLKYVLYSIHFILYIENKIQKVNNNFHKIKNVKNEKNSYNI